MAWASSATSRESSSRLSKKLENHAYSVALFAMYYNFVKIHGTLRMSPAMAAGVFSLLWEIGDIVTLVESRRSQARTARPVQKGEIKYLTNTLSRLG